MWHCLESAQSHLQDAAHDIRGDFGVWRVLVSARGLQVVLQAGLPERHERSAVPLDGRVLPDGRGDAGHADLHHRLVVVVRLVVLAQTKRRFASEHPPFSRPPQN